MSRFELELAQVLAAVRAVPGWEGRAVIAEPAVPVLASPSWRGVDGSPWRASDKASGESLFVKIMDSDAQFYIDVAWRVGTLERMLDPALVDAALATRETFQKGPPLPTTRGVFEEIEHFHAAAVAAAAELPPYADWLLAELRFAAEAMKESAGLLVPIHGDGNVSNMLIGDSGEVRLIDWDRATNADPLEDLGSFLVEAFDQEPEAWDAFVRHTRRPDEHAFNRALVYGVADDFRWGLIGALLAAKSSRKTYEFYKFASWRFLRCRM